MTQGIGKTQLIHENPNSAGGKKLHRDKWRTRQTILFIVQHKRLPPTFPKSIEDIRDRRKSFVNLGVGVPDLRKEGGR